MKSYNAAIYLRLSKEDRENNNSIDMQRQITTKYAKSHNYSIIDEYIDNGYSGILASRPELNRLMVDIVNVFKKSAAVIAVLTLFVMCCCSNTDSVETNSDRVTPTYISATYKKNITGSDVYNNGWYYDVALRWRHTSYLDRVDII